MVIYMSRGKSELLEDLNALRQKQLDPRFCEVQAEVGG